MTGRFDFGAELLKRFIAGLGLFLGLVIGLQAAPSTGAWTPTVGHAAVYVSSVDRNTINYHDGAWHANGRPVMVECATEDACETQIVGDVLWIVRVSR